MDNVHVGVQLRRDRSARPPARRRRSGALEVGVVDPTGVDGPDFRGPAVQGKRGERFLYLTWGDVGPDGEFEMFRPGQADARPGRHGGHGVRDQDRIPCRHGRPDGRRRRARCARVDPCGDHLVGAGRLTSAPSPRRSPSSRSAPEVCPRARTASTMAPDGSGVRMAQRRGGGGPAPRLGRSPPRSGRRGDGVRGCPVDGVSAALVPRARRRQGPRAARPARRRPTASARGPARRGANGCGQVTAADRPLGDVDGRMTGQAETAVSVRLRLCAWRRRRSASSVGGRHRALTGSCPSSLTRLPGEAGHGAGAGGSGRAARRPTRARTVPPVSM